jgi:hypothetical protein
MGREQQGTSATARPPRAVGTLLAGLAALLALTLGALLATAGPAFAAGPYTVKVQVFNRHGVVEVNNAKCEPPPEPTEPDECEYTFAENEKVELKAEPTGEWEVSLFGPECGGSPECTIDEIKKDTTVWAFFSPITPESPVITSPEAGQVIESDTGEVTLEFEDSDPRAVEFKCGIDTEPKTTCMPEEAITYSALSPGQHEVEVWALNSEKEFSTAQAKFEIVTPSTETEPPPLSQPPPSFPIFPPGGGGSRLVPVAGIHARWRVQGRLTRVRRLVLDRLLAGDRVVVRCRGRGCGFGKKKLTAGGATLNLTRLFKKHPLGAGAVIRLSIATRRAGTQAFEIKIRAGKQPKVIRR